MEELLVVLACTSGKGCAPTASAYYESRPSLKEFVKHTEYQIKKNTHPTLYEYGIPAVLLSLGTTGTTQLSKDFSVRYNRQFIELIFSKGF